MALHMSERDDRATWPADDIGRSAWRSPHRTHDFVDTYPTGPAPLEAAHAASELDDVPHTARDGWLSALLMLASALGAVAGCWALVRWLA